MHKVSAGLLLLGALGTTGCADLALTSPPLSTIPQQPSYAEECHPSYPCYDSMEEVDEWIKPKIYKVSPLVYWEGTRAVASSMMQYYGNRAEESFTLNISGGSTATRTAEASSNASLLANTNTHTTPGFGLEAPNRKTCGNFAQLLSQHTAITTIWLTFRGFGELRTMRAGDHSDAQPECTCGGGGGGPGDDPPILSVNPDFAPSATCTGGGGGGGTGTTYRCYMVRLDHYWYYPDTDTYEYRYSEEYSYCEETS